MTGEVCSSSSSMSCNGSIRADMAWWQGRTADDAANGGGDACKGQGSGLTWMTGNFPAVGPIKVHCADVDDRADLSA